MLAEAFRLRRSQDIQRVLRLGRTQRSAFLRLKYLRNKHHNHRWAFIVSNKVSKRATVRNRLRRQLKSIILLHRAKFLGTVTSDIVVLVSPNIVSENYQAIRSEFEFLLMRSRLLPRQTNKVTVWGVIFPFCPGTVLFWYYACIKRPYHLIMDFLNFCTPTGFAVFGPPVLNMPLTPFINMEQSGEAWKPPGGLCAAIPGTPAAGIRWNESC